jgi:hypothetical protein
VRLQADGSQSDTASPAFPASRSATISSRRCLQKSASCDSSGGSQYEIEMSGSRSNPCLHKVRNNQLKWLPAAVGQLPKLEGLLVRSSFGFV